MLNRNATMPRRNSLFFFFITMLQAYRNKGNRSISGNSGAQQQSPGPSTPLNGAPGSPVVMTESHHNSVRLRTRHVRK